MRYLGIFPLIFFLFLATHGSQNLLSKVKIHDTRFKHTLLGIRLLIMIGLSGIMFFVGVKELTVYLFLIILNIFLFLFSHIIQYQDGKSVFEAGLYGSSILVLGTSLFSSGLQTFREALSLLSALITGVFAFLTCIISIFYEIKPRYQYQLLIHGATVIFISVIHIIFPLSVSLLVCLLGITLLYFAIRKIKNFPVPKKENSTVSLRRILAGDRINKKKLTSTPRKLTLHTWIASSPNWFQRALELANLIILIAIIITYITSVINGQITQVMLWYWLSLGVFLANTFLLKKNGFISNISRFSIALVVNFALYSALLTSGYDNIANVLPFLILWTIICQIALFYINKLKTHFLFTRKDYLYRTITTCCASLVNIILFFQIHLPGQFLFFLIFLYVGIELGILYYIFQKLSSSARELDESLKI